MVDYTYILFKCPICGNVLKTPETFVGTQGCCPFCENAISVPVDEKKFIKKGILGKPG